ncbi:S8 family serine peptidase [Paenibacillus sp. NEAU-GSW1]|uniref:S8 family peptidase n=1 Tax=Paenibacillus sp. NEAU-GSW1 TaxID=2682486 RepID=UPI0020A6AEF1|nr:S8 family serine peptidase [Paenibacillus sp. NEAU-GSW1]
MSRSLLHLYKKLAAIVLLAAIVGGAAASIPHAADAAQEEPQSWLLKWRSPGHAHALPGTIVLRRQAEAAVDLVAPADPGADITPWLLLLRSTPGVEYVHPNQTVHVLAAAPNASGAAAGAAAQPLASQSARAPGEANDPELAKQLHLKQIGAIEAWKSVREQTDLTIAVIDTGVDLDHPDLKDNLVPGVNLVQPNQAPDDDNGHGTSVAGVIAASGNNGKGGSGILWKAKLMPIKALDYRGDGTEQELGEAILYAVRKKAKIIVLSVGLHRYSPYMLDIVEYAESKGSLLVAAAGNDGQSMGSKAEVKYPAAYPTVLAVGGARKDNTPDTRSNPGSELDLVAPWNVYTTAIGGRYKNEEGTSMAAPQAAAAAALIWARYPQIKPYQVRELLRQTARDIGSRGFDEQSGYGLLQIHKAVAAALDSDRFEPNNSYGQAAVLPLSKQIPAALATGGDRDWYRVNVPYDGTLTIRYEAILSQGKTAPPVRLSHYRESRLQKSEDTKLGSKNFEIKVKKGWQYIRLEPINSNISAKVPYLMTASFQMGKDSYESNDKSYEAFTLQPRSQTINGSFHQTADRDWFVINFTHSGTLSMRLSTNTARIDPGLAVQKAGQSLVDYDDHQEGESEQSPVLTITPGKYYFRVHNAISSEASPTVGTYTLKLTYTPKYEDPNEPNDKYYEALRVSSGTQYVGVMGKAGDADWFQVRLAKESVLDFRLEDIPDGKVMRMEVYDKKQKRLFSQSSGGSKSLFMSDKRLQAGAYYVKLTSNEPFDKQYYRFRIDIDELIAGFRDISGHWARDAIVAMNKSGIATGTGNFMFEPDRSITRAEAVAMTVKAYKPGGGGSTAVPVSYDDMNSKHWAYSAVRKASQLGWVKGFPDGDFKPNQPITRAEMATMIARAEKINAMLPIYPPFADVPKTHWAAPVLSAMKLNSVISGKEGNRFEPEAKASRAEFTTLLYRLYK